MRALISKLCAPGREFIETCLLRTKNRENSTKNWITVKFFLCLNLDCSLDFVPYTYMYRVYMYTCVYACVIWILHHRKPVRILRKHFTVYFTVDLVCVFAAGFLQEPNSNSCLWLLTVFSRTIFALSALPASGFNFIARFISNSCSNHKQNRRNAAKYLWWIAIEREGFILRGFLCVIRAKKWKLDVRVKSRKPGIFPVVN